MSVVSFALSAVARIAVPPGKWFCLARTGLGYKQYSCCVCGLHNECFHKHWNASVHMSDWKDRLGETVDRTLFELGYTEHSGKDAELMRTRIFNLLTDRDSYIVSPAFAKLIESTPERVRILTDGPECLVKLVFPSLQSYQIVTAKSAMSLREVADVSEIHVGSSVRDLRVPQTRAIINRTIKDELEKVSVYPRLTEQAMEAILKS